MFRARLSWTLLGGVGLVGLTNEMTVAIRGSLLGVAIAAFLWLNQPLVAWIRRSRALADPRWKPAAIGLALRVVALAVVVAISW
jgi:hypothetical protein